MTKKQRKRKEYKYCLKCGRKFKKDEKTFVVNKYEPRDCTYGSVNMSGFGELHDGTGTVVCNDCFKDMRPRMRMGHYVIPDWIIPSEPLHETMDIDIMKRVMEKVVKAFDELEEEVILEATKTNKTPSNLTLKWRYAMKQDFKCAECGKQLYSACYNLSKNGKQAVCISCHPHVENHRSLHE